MVLHSTDPADPAVLAASRTPGVLQTVDFATRGNVAADFATLKASQKLNSKVAQPLMVSEFYPGYITSDGEKQFPIVYDPTMVASQLDKVLNTTYCGGSTSFALWLFAACSDFGFWGGTLWAYQSKSLGVLTPSYDVGAPVDESGGIRPLFHMLQAVLKRHGANTSSVLPPSPPVAAFGKVVMTKRLPLWRALQALAPNPARSGTVRTMEELQQGYGYIHYSTPVPHFEAPSAGSLVLSGMRDRALVYFDRKLYQTCTRGDTVDAVVCSAAAAAQRVEQLDILVENQGRVTGGVIGTELPWRGIRQYVTLDGRILANWTITPLPLNNTQALAPLWSSGDADQVAGPAFFRAEFTIATGELADTFLTLPGWQKGQAFINGHNLARYVSTGPQFSFYCPAGFLKVGTNELILFETDGAPSNRTVEFTAMQTVVGPKPAPAPAPPPPGPPPPCPTGYDSHAPGLWSNCKLGVSSTCIDDKAIVTTAACAEKCNATKSCLAFEVYQVSGQKTCYLFIHELKLPFIPDKDCLACVKHGGAPTPVPPSPPAPPSPKPPPPPPPQPQRGNTTGHSFPRLGNCWGADPFITPKMWNYLGFPNMTNASWGRYDVQYINPFDSCCWKKEMDSWIPMIRAIKKENPQAVVLATFHATEIWEVDLKHKGGWLPDKCLVRNTNGELCSWWAGLVFTNNLFDPDCMRAALDNAFGALPELVAAGVDGVFLDGVVDFDIGCSPATPCNGNCHPTADINCTHANCTHTPQQPWPVLAQQFTALYVHWFEQLKSKYGDKFVWVNNLAQDQTPFVPVSNGRMYEGGAGLDNCYSGGRPISSFVSEIRMWSTKAVQPSYLNLHMNGNMGGGTWRIGRWQNLVTGGEMMRLMTDFRRMRFGLGVALLTDGYFGYDVGSEMYGAPSFFTEYEAELGQAVADPVRIFVDGTQEVWTREFEHGFTIVSSLTEQNHTVSLPAPVLELPPSAQPGRLAGGREAPAWQFVVENSGGLGSDENFHVAGYHDWWADDAHRASFRTIEGNWTAVSDQTQSHNYGADFLVGFVMPGGPSGTSQGEPGSFSAAWTFESPASGLFSISTTAVDAHLYPLTDGAIICVRVVGMTAGNSAACIARSTLDQRAGIRDGRWQTMVASVSLKKDTSYEVLITWDPTCNGYIAADAILVESHALYHGGGTAAGPSKEVTVGAMDGRVVLKV